MFILKMSGDEWIILSVYITVNKYNIVQSVITSFLLEFI